MKLSVAALSAFSVVALAAGPAQFTNVNLDVMENTPFTITVANCEGGCTINLQTGDPSDLKTVETVASGVTNEVTITLKDLPEGKYNFQLVDSKGNVNFSQQFPLGGTAAPSPTASAPATDTKTGTTSGTTSGSSTSSKTTASSGTQTNTESTGTSSKPASSTGKMNTATGSSSTTATSTTNKAPTSSAPPTSTAPPTSKTSSTIQRSTTTTTTTKSSATTTPPDSGVGKVSSPMALIAGVAMAVAYLA